MSEAEQLHPKSNFSSVMPASFYISVASFFLVNVNPFHSLQS